MTMTPPHGCICAGHIRVAHIEQLTPFLRTGRLIDHSRQQVQEPHDLSGS